MPDLTLRLAVLPDFPEEGWPSMDLCAEMLLRELGTSEPVAAERVCPPFRCRFCPVTGQGGRNADRFLNRHWDYPRFLKRARSRFALFHVVDHSYAHLLHVLPAGQAGVYCHDLDTFRCLLEPAQEPRPAWFRAMMRRVLNGFRKAAVVFHSTAAVGDRVRQLGLVDPARLVYAPYGTAAEFTPEPAAVDADQSAPFTGDAPYLLHVGSCIARKRIDVLLELFAAVRRRQPELRLLQVGGTWTPPQQEQVGRLGLDTAVRQVRGLDRVTLAALYRRARLVLLPSAAEGFGLPALEALACGACVVASDLPSLREVGGAAAVYVPVGNVAAWSDRVLALLANPDQAPTPATRRQQAAKFSWANHARIISEAYHRLAEARPSRA
jgi:glycosyltransferase involved in cell wall biosynthesis